MPRHYDLPADSVDLSAVPRAELEGVLRRAAEIEAFQMPVDAGFVVVNAELWQRLEAAIVALLQRYMTVRKPAAADTPAVINPSSAVTGGDGATSAPSQPRRGGRQVGPVAKLVIAEAAAGRTRAEIVELLAERKVRTSRGTPYGDANVKQMIRQARQRGDLP